MPALLRRRGVEAHRSTATAFNPLTYISWLDAYWAEDPSWSNPGNGNAVASWRNAGSNASDLAQASATLKPIYRSTVSLLGNRPAVEFDGSNDFMASSTITNQSQPWTYVIVANPTTTADQSIYAVQNNSQNRGIGVSGGAWALAAGNTSFPTGGTASTGPHLLLGYCDGVNGTLKVDGSTVISPGTSVGTATFNARRMGGVASGTLPFTGHMAFAGMVNRALTGTEETDLRSWAQSYYGTP